MRRKISLPPFVLYGINSALLLPSLLKSQRGAIAASALATISSGGFLLQSSQSCPVARVLAISRDIWKTPVWNKETYTSCPLPVLSRTNNAVISPQAKAIPAMLSPKAPTTNAGPVIPGCESPCWIPALDQ